MKNPNVKVKENDLGPSPTSLGIALEKYERAGRDSEDLKLRDVLKDNFRSNTTGLDDDLSIDIQDAIGRDSSLSMVADNILVSAEGEIVTLEGEVYRDDEKITAGDIAVLFAGEDNVNNYLRVINSSN